MEQSISTRDSVYVRVAVLHVHSKLFFFVKMIFFYHIILIKNMERFIFSSKFMLWSHNFLHPDLGEFH